MARPRLEQLREAVEERVGISVRSRDTVATLEESAEQFKTFAMEAGEMAYQALTHLNQRPHEMPRERRNRIAQKARQAFVSDPLAGREVEMLADFALGNGVAMAEAKDDDVQEVIREAWKDANNQEKLTSFDAQRALSNTLRTDANLYLTGYRGNGKFRVGLVDGDSVTDFVPDPEDRLRPLWYVTKTRKIMWDFDKDVPKFESDGEGGQPKEKVTYYPHWRNYAEAKSEREARDEPALQEPPEHKKDPGEAVIFHLRINRLTEQIFGTPPFARSLRFYCHDEETETLTAEGWKGLAELRERWADGSALQLAAVDDHGVLRYETPSAMADDHFEGEMLAFRARGMDMLVTPNHRMALSGGGFTQADVAGGSRIPAVAHLASPTAIQEVVLPAVYEHEEAALTTSRARGAAERRTRVLAALAGGASMPDVAVREGITRQRVWQLAGDRRSSHPKAQRSEQRLDADGFFSWLGWWIAEGDSRGVVTQKLTSDRLRAVQEACRGSGLAGTERTDGVMWQWRAARPKQLMAWIRENAGLGAANKRVPSVVFDASVEQQERVLDGLMGGDGTPTDWAQKGGRYCTVSRQLADDVQRLVVNTGRRATVRWVDRSRWGMRGIWTVSIALTPTWRLPVAEEVPYKGAVYCFTVPSGRLITRRRGAVAITGNSAMNQFTESRVAKAQAAATFVARNVLKGGPKQLAQSAQSVLQRTGELGTSGGFGEDQLDEPARRKNPSPGSFLFQNEQEKLESLNLSTGGGEAQADAQIIRAPLAASSGFGQHYLGDASNANLATATTLELPVLMMVQAWQEVLEQLFRWFTDMAIEEAVSSGRLGGAGNREDGDKPLSELRLTEAEDKAEAEKRTGKDLSYTFEMPYPGRRNLPDVLAAATTMLGIPTLGTNEEMTKVILGFVLTHGLQLAEPSDTLEAIMEEWRKAREEADKQAEEERQAAIAQMQGGDPNAPSNASDDDEGSQNGEKRRGKDPSGDMGEELEHVPVDLRPGVEMLDAEVNELFRELVADPALRALAGSRNGNGN